MLRRLIEFFPSLKIQEPNGAGRLERVKSFPFYALCNRVMWGVWRRVPERVRPRPPMAFSAWLADRLLVKWIGRSRIFHGCTALCLASLRAAKREGAITLVESASCHPRHWKKVEADERRRFGAKNRISSENLTEGLLRRMDKEFEECDWIVVPSVVAQQSFAEYGLQEKTVVVRTGVDTEFFFPGSQDAAGAVFRVCYVGRVELAKGIGYLLEAWKRLGLPGAELVLVGEVKPEMRSLLEGCESNGVRLTGFLPGREEVARCYQESKLFVQPSPNEGLAQVLLEAMASGLPVVATDKTGAADCMTNGTEGLIVSARDVDALADAVLWCYQHREQSWEMGRAARARIERQFTLKHYNERVIELYRSLDGMEGGTG
jgi:glycosyltransferase involved in cell wall biosynthesis